jgi:hypothetical protein
MREELAINEEVSETVQLCDRRRVMPHMDEYGCAAVHRQMLMCGMCTDKCGL